MTDNDSMNLTDEQLRQVRVWAIETALGRASMVAGESLLLLSVLEAAGELVDFVLVDPPATPRR